MTDLPAAVLTWIESICGGTIVRLERAVARREAWLVDVTGPDGGIVERFFRIERDRSLNDPSALRKEVMIVRALQDTSVPVAKLHGYDDTLRCALFERLSGRPDLPNVPLAQQRAVMRDFMDVIAKLHLLKVEDLELSGLHYPESPEECALAEVNLILEQHADYLKTAFDPLLRYGIAWLRRFVPDQVARISLVQGDTGPANFMFEGDRVTAVFDWEWGHLGDPIEDLGNIWVREFWNPSGGMAGLLERYQTASGIAVEPDRVRYYAVQQQIRGMMGIHAATESPDPHEPLTWYLAFRYVGDRATCEMLGEAMHIALEPPLLPEDEQVSDPLAAAALCALSNDIAPAAGNALAAARTKDVEILIRCMERVARYQQKIDDLDKDDIQAVLNTKTDTLAEAIQSLNDAIDAHGLNDEAIIRLLYRRAVRREWLYAPCAELYPNRRWSEI